MAQDESTENGGVPRGEAAYRHLFEAIQTGLLKPGMRVREVEIAERFGISRTPVREAIRRLESEGLVVHVPRQGAVIKQMDQREVIELYEMRAALEGTAAQMAAQHASEAEILELEELNALMRAAAGDDRAGDDRKVAEANRRFHDDLYQAAKNPFLIKSVTALANALAVLGGTTLRDKERTEAAFAEHQEILEAIRARDGARADRAARAHILAALRSRMRLMREAELQEE